jgi:Activator of Hsp90 ATPase homolog 1-like protein
MASRRKKTAAIRMPDISARPFDLKVQRTFGISAAALYEAWSRGFDRWFAAPGSVLMEPEVNAVFFFETEFKPESAQAVERHPHYGRFLRLIQNRLVEMTWVTGALGTEGAETIVTVELTRNPPGTRLHLKHAGFANAAARDRHLSAWPMVLAHMDAMLMGEHRTARMRRRSK